MLKKLLLLLILSGLTSGNAFADGIDSFTKLMLHMDGANTSTTFLDDSAGAKTFTAVGNAQVTTAQSVFGGASLSLAGGGGGNLSYGDSADWDMGTSDFTIDLRARITSLGGHVCFFEMGSYTGDGLVLQRNTDGNLYYAQSGTLKSAAWTPSLNTWYHVAIVRQGRYTSIYIDGVLLATHDFSSTQNLNAGTGGMVIGRIVTGGFTNYFVGQMDEFRISSGIARWTGNFTPPTSAYSASVRRRIRIIQGD